MELLNAGAEPNIQNDEGDTALMLTVSYQVRHNPTDIIIKLLNVGANPYIVDNAGNNFNEIIKRSRFALILKYPQVQKAFAEYDERFARYKKDLAAHIEEGAKPIQMPEVLTNMITDYTISKESTAAPAVEEQEEEKKEAASWCVIL